MQTGRQKILYRMVAGDPWAQIAVTSFTQIILIFQCQSHFEEIMWYMYAMILSRILYRESKHIYVSQYLLQTNFLDAE